jgi:hypothetical protein
MASVELTYDPKSLVIANLMLAGETIDYDWSIDEMYQIVVTKGTVVIDGGSYDAISINDISPGTKLSIAATTDASFLTLLRSDNGSVIEQIMPEDGVANYYEFMQSYRPDWYDQGVPDVPPATINITSGDVLVTSADMKSMVLDGWS